MKKPESNLTKIGAWSGVPVHVDTSGMFHAKVDDIAIRADKLETVRTKIDAALKPSAKKPPMSLPVIVIVDNEAIEYTTLVGISRANRAFQFKPPITTRRSRHGIRVLADTAGNRERAEAFVRAEKLVTEARNAVSSRAVEVLGYGQISIEGYQLVADAVTKAHTKSAK